jgi:hypothetical protein
LTPEPRTVAQLAMIVNDTVEDWLITVWGDGACCQFFSFRWLHECIRTNSWLHLADNPGGSVALPGRWESQHRAITVARLRLAEIERQRQRPQVPQSQPVATSTGSRRFAWSARCAGDRQFCPPKRGTSHESVKYCALSRRCSAAWASSRHSSSLTRITPVHLAGTLAVWALDVGRMQAVGSNWVFDVELADVGIDDHETLIDQQRAKRKP